MKAVRPLIFIVLPLVLYFGTIWQRPLFSPDEIRYAEIPREMLASGDWVVPRLAGMLYFEKPVLGYWLIAGSMKIFGENPFAVRFPGAAATLLTALLVYLWGRRADGDELGLAAAGIYLTTGLVFAVGTFAVLDAPFTFLVILALVSAYFADLEPRRWRRWLYLALAGVGLGGGFLIKGLLAPVLVGAAGVPYLIWQRHYRNLFTFIWIPLLVAAAVALPWSLAIHRVEPDFWRQFLYVEHFQRVVSGEGANDDRSEPFWYYLPVLLGGALPWLLLLPAMLKGIGVDRKWFVTGSAFRLAMTAAAVWLVLLSLSSAKLGTYILPCFAPLALLGGAALLRYGENGDFAWSDQIFRWLGRLLIGLAAAYVICHLAVTFRLVRDPGIMPYGRGELVVVPVLAVAAAAVWLLTAASETGYRRKFVGWLLGISFLMLPVHGFMPRRIVRNHTPELFLKTAVAPWLDSSTLLAAEKAMLPAAAWTFKRVEGLEIYERPGEMRYGAERAGRRVLAAADLVPWIGRRQMVVLTQSKRLSREAPGPKTVMVSGKNRAIVYPGPDKAVGSPDGMISVTGNKL